MSCLLFEHCNQANPTNAVVFVGSDNTCTIGAMPKLNQTKSLQIMFGKSKHKTLGKRHRSVHHVYYLYNWSGCVNIIKFMIRINFKVLNLNNHLPVHIRTSLRRRWFRMIIVINEIVTGLFVLKERNIKHWTLCKQGTFQHPFLCMESTKNSSKAKPKKTKCSATWYFKLDKTVQKIVHELEDSAPFQVTVQKILNKI